MKPCQCQLAPSEAQKLPRPVVCVIALARQFKVALLFLPLDHTVYAEHCANAVTGCHGQPNAYWMASENHSATCICFCDPLLSVSTQPRNRRAHGELWLVSAVVIRPDNHMPPPRLHQRHQNRIPHHPPNNRSQASSTKRCVRYSPNWRISLFLSTRKVSLG